MTDRGGLFLWSPHDGSVSGARARGDTDGVLTLEAPAGTFVASAEAWSPAVRRAGRFRVGVERRAVPEDIAALSDLLMITPSADPPELLEAAAPSALLKTEIRPGQTFAIGWEVSGLGFRAETLRFEVGVNRVNRSVLRRIGEFLRVSGSPRLVSIGWDEPGPTRPGPVFRYLDLDLPRLDPGDYEVRLILRTGGRSDVVSTREFTVRAR